MKAVPIWMFMHPRQKRLRVHFLFYQRIRKAMESVDKEKPIPVHWLRYSSFGTCLLKGGTDLRYIQSQLSHCSTQTGGFYARGSNKAISKIQRPLDRLDLSNKKNNLPSKKQPDISG